MTTLYGENGKVIQYSLSNTIYSQIKNMYAVEMPIVMCDYEKDAEYIQQKVNEFVGELSKKLLKGEN